MRLTTGIQAVKPLQIAIGKIRELCVINDNVKLIG